MDCAHRILIWTRKSADINRASEFRGNKGGSERGRYLAVVSFDVKRIRRIQMAANGPSVSRKYFRINAAISDGYKSFDALGDIQLVDCC